MAEPLPGVGDEGAHFAGFLDDNREAVIEGVLLLSQDAQRRTILPSGWTPLQLLSHVLHMERRWFVWRFLGEEIGAPFGDWRDGDPDADEAAWYVDPATPAEDLAAALRETGRRVSEVLATRAMTEKSAELRGADHPDLDLRWTCFHVLAEYARHAGHLDIVVELAE